MKSEIFAIAFLITLACFGQQLDLSSLDKLAAKSKGSTVITLDQDKLALASSLVDDKDGKNLMKGIKAISVRTFEFADKGGYSRSDLDPIRKQLTGTGWSRAISVKEDNEDVEIYFYKSSDSGGLAIVAAEPKELTVVNIIGPADLSSLGKLSGLAGLGGVQGLIGGGSRKAPPPPAAPKSGSKDDEE